MMRRRTTGSPEPELDDLGKLQSGELGLIFIQTLNAFQRTHKAKWAIATRTRWCHIPRSSRVTQPMALFRACIGTKTLAHASPGRLGQS